MARKKLEVGRAVDKNIKYRGKMQYAVAVRRNGIKVFETFSSLDEARVYRDKVLSEIRGKQFESPVRLKQTKFSDLVDMWLARNPNASPKTGILSVS